MKRLFSIVVLMLLVWVYSGTALAQGDPPHTPVRVAPEQTFQGDLATNSEWIIVDGTVHGDVTSWSGDIVINGHVTGDVVSYSGNINIGTGAQVEGNVLTVGGVIAGQTAQATINGQLFGGVPGGNALSGLITVITPSTGDDAAIAPFVRGAFALAGMILLVVLSTLSTLLWPQRTAVTRLTLRTAPWRSFVLGTLTTLLLALAILPLGALFAFTLIGVPLIVPLLLALHLPYVYGLATLGQLVGQRLTRQQRDLATPVGVIVLVLPLVVVGLATPFLALILFYLVACSGVGASILSRAGTLAMRHA